MSDPAEIPAEITAGLSYHAAAASAGATMPGVYTKSLTSDSAPFLVDSYAVFASLSGRYNEMTASTTALTDRTAPQNATWSSK